MSSYQEDSNIIRGLLWELGGNVPKKIRIRNSSSERRKGVNKLIFSMFNIFWLFLPAWLNGHLSPS